MYLYVSFNFASSKENLQTLLIPLLAAFLIHNLLLLLHTFL